MVLKGQKRKNWKRHIPDVFVSAFRERSDLCLDAAQRGLASRTEAGFIKAGIGL